MFRYVKLIAKNTPEGDVTVKIHKKILFLPLSKIMDDTQIAEFCYKFNKFIGKRHSQGKGCSKAIENLLMRINEDKDFLYDLNSHTDFYGNVDFESLLLTEK